jgi:hypothetical protein
MKNLARSFAGGEITPELAGRLDLIKYQTGVALCRNFQVLPHGPLARRPGFEFTNEAKDSTQAVRIMPFSFSASQTAVLEFGHLYIRFHIDGSTLVETAVAITSIVANLVTTTAPHSYATGDWVFIGNRFHKITVTGASTFTTADLWAVSTTAVGATASRAYTLVSPYDEGDIFNIRFAQSSDVVTLSHPNYQTRELSRLSATLWSLTAVSFAPPSGAPTGQTATPTVAVVGNPIDHRYVITAVQADGVTESLPSGVATANNDLTIAGNFNSVNWTGVDGATRYNVYKQRGGIYGYMGQVRPSAAATIGITAISRVAPSYDVNVQTTGAHGYITGDEVLIENTGQTTLNGLWEITVDDADEFHFESGRNITAAAATGNASTPALELIDDNVLADTTQSPPEDIISLNLEVDDYPTTCAYHEQRRWFAGTVHKPQVVWATRTGTENNLTNSIPARDGDALEFRVASMQNNQVLHLVPLSDMIALTAGAEFRIFSDGQPAITPNSISCKAQGGSGASSVQPVLTSGSILYVQAQGSRIREFAYGGESANYGYKSIDISLMAPHRFNGYTITQLAYTRAPDPTLWAVRSDGILLGMTYIPEQQVYGWHAHDTDGLVESACVVAEGNEDVLYVVVRRTVNARTVRYIERLRSRFFVDQEDCFYVDSGLTYDGAATTTLTGLYHLEGETVDILADGAVEPQQVVTGGAVTLSVAASVVHVGLPITADMTTLPLSIESAQASGQGTAKNVNKVAIRVRQSSLVKAGPTFDSLRDYPARAITDPYGSPPALRDGELELSIDSSWNQDGAVCIRADQPLPLTIVSITLDTKTGG